jgi:hypothetical protein
MDPYPYHVQTGIADSNFYAFTINLISRRFLYERIKETVGRQYNILHPLQNEYWTARRVRCSPLYSTLSAQGAGGGLPRLISNIHLCVR